MSLISGARALIHHRAYLRAVAFSADACRLASVDNDGVLVLWSLDTFTTMATRKLEAPYSERHGRALAFLPQGGLLVSHSGGIGVFDEVSLEPIRRGEPYNRPDRIQLSDGGRSYLGTEHLYDIETFELRALSLAGTAGEFTGFLVQCAHPATDAVFMCNDGGYEDVGMAAEGPLEARRVSLYGPDLRNERRGRTLPMGQGVYAAAFDPRTRRFVFDLNGRLEAWADDGSTEEVLGAWSIGGKLHCFGDASACIVGEKPFAPVTLRWWAGCFAGQPTELELPPSANVHLSQNGEWVLWTEIPVDRSFVMKVVDLRPLGLPRS